MLNEILKDLKDAIKKGDKKRIKHNYALLNRLGVDNMTINLLLSRL